jgi:hypothetical protein
MMLRRKEGNLDGTKTRSLTEWQIACSDWAKLACVAQKSSTRRMGVIACLKLMARSAAQLNSKWMGSNG